MVRTNAFQTLSCSASAKPIVPNAISAPMTSASERTRRAVSVVVGLTGQDLVGAEQLLEQHDAGELVGQRHRAEREVVVGGGVAAAVAERPADDENQVAALHPPLLQEAAEAHGVHLLALAVQRADERPVRDAPDDLLVLTHLDDLEAGMPREQPLIVLHV